MNHRPSVPASNSRIINGTALGFSILFLLASLAAACFVGEWGHVFLDWRRIMISPCPLVTDYLAIGGLSSAFLNAGACGLACFFFMVLLKGDSHANTLAGYFLVVAHCFYGLNFLNMWPCFLAPFLYMKRKGLDFKENLHICMFATSFAPFISEFLFRYTLGDDFVYGQVRPSCFPFCWPSCSRPSFPEPGRGTRAITFTTAALPLGSSAFLYLISCTGPWESSLPRL